MAHNMPKRSQLKNVRYEPFKSRNMATILKSEQREFKEDANKIDNFRILSDISRLKNGIKPQY